MKIKSLIFAGVIFDFYWTNSQLFVNQEIYSQQLSNEPRAIVILKTLIGTRRIELMLHFYPI